MNEERRENYIYQWRQKLSPYVTAVMNRLNEEEQERERNAFIERKRNIELGLLIEQANRLKAESIH